MFKKRYTSENNIDLSLKKRQKKLEALQKLVQIKPDIKGKEIYFFPTLKKYFKGIIIQRLFKGHRSALATIFLEPNSTRQSIASILCETNHEPYWKTTLLINVQDILLNIKEKILPGKEFSGTAIQEINEVCCGQSTVGFEDVMQIRGTQLVRNEKDYTPFAFMEKNGQIYRRVDYTLVVKENFICENCFKLKKTLQQIQQRILTGVNSTKTIHASKEILIKKVNQQRLVIKKQKEIIINLKKRLNQKIKNEEEKVSIEMANIAQVVSEKVNSKKIEISNLHPIFQELICVQIGKSKGTQYHPI
ncbi:hypothetical protein Glove_562g45 [Diversispora epigaea]|uniref:Uncharacterized protein n=1 Tax=Diversispora epigaea TaxID=1348612 RepID=A0A397GJ33_9GLOM|nr:hypothetical protein Glove_562g45 [Diversispora epigaea]